jgi:hypothetical protein
VSVESPEYWRDQVTTLRASLARATAELADAREALRGIIESVDAFEKACRLLPKRVTRAQEIHDTDAGRRGAIADARALLARDASGLVDEEEA